MSLKEHPLLSHMYLIASSRIDTVNLAGLKCLKNSEISDCYNKCVLWICIHDENLSTLEYILCKKGYFPAIFQSFEKDYKNQQLYFFVSSRKLSCVIDKHFVLFQSPSKST